MNKEQFIEKYKDGVPEPEWRTSASRIFWARSYDASPEVLKEMSKDFIEACPDDGSTSMHKAKHTLGMPY